MSLFFNPQSITAEKARDLMKSLDKKYVFLDVRTMSEYIMEHIKGAISIPLDELDRRAKKELPNKTVTIFVYCHSGARATSAVKLLKQLGYTNVQNLGGIINWPYETESGMR